VSKSRRTGDVARMMERMIAYRVLVKKPEGNQDVCERIILKLILEK
jgi:hypothetical protein